MGQRLPLAADPRSARAARTWVRDRLADSGRDDLVDNAELAVTELVANAVLHGHPPLEVTIDGLPDHPRIGVVDHDPHPAVVLSDPGSSATFGRGVGLVAMLSTAWGNEFLADGAGKSVWFEPSATVTQSHGEMESGAVPRKDATMTVTFLGVPVALMHRAFNAQRELARELRLLVLAHPDPIPAVTEVLETFALVLPQTSPARESDQYDPNLRQDILFPYPSTAAPRLAVFGELVDQVLANPQIPLLSRGPVGEERELMDWMLDQVRRQAAGEAPAAWAGCHH